MMPPSLTTDRLLLRAPLPGDAARLAAALNDFGIVQVLAGADAVQTCLLRRTPDRWVRQGPPS